MGKFQLSPSGLVEHLQMWGSCLGCVTPVGVIALANWEPKSPRWGANGSEAYNLLPQQVWRLWLAYNTCPGRLYGSSEPVLHCPGGLDGSNKPKNWVYQHLTWCWGNALQPLAHLFPILWGWENPAAMLSPISFEKNCTGDARLVVLAVAENWMRVFGMIALP